MTAIRFTLVIPAMAVIALIGCIKTSSAPPVWVAVDKPLKDFEVHCMASYPSPSDCFFSTDGFWRSTSGPGSELAWPDGVSIDCRQDEKKCILLDATVETTGKLQVGSTELPISLWTADQIIATGTGGLCDIGDQLVVDVQNKTVMRRRYPTKEQSNDKLCGGAFSKTDTYVLHGGFWRLTPMVAKTFDEMPR